MGEYADMEVDNMMLTDLDDHVDPDLEREARIISDGEEAQAIELSAIISVFPDCRIFRDGVLVYERGSDEVS